MPRRALDGLEADAFEVVVDDWGAMGKASPDGDPAEFSAKVATLLSTDRGVLSEEP